MCIHIYAFVTFQQTNYLFVSEIGPFLPGHKNMDACRAPVIGLVKSRQDLI